MISFNLVQQKHQIPQLVRNKAVVRKTEDPNSQPEILLCENSHRLSLIFFLKFRLVFLDCIGQSSKYLFILASVFHGLELSGRHICLQNYLTVLFFCQKIMELLRN